MTSATRETARDDLAAAHWFRRTCNCERSLLASSRSITHTRWTSMIIRPIDRESLREQVRMAEPFPYFYVDDFLDEAFADQVLDAFPSFEEAAQMGRSFTAVNEKKKIQVT